MDYLLGVPGYEKILLQYNKTSAKEIVCNLVTVIQVLISKPSLYEAIVNNLLTINEVITPYGIALY